MKRITGALATIVAGCAQPAMEPAAVGVGVSARIGDVLVNGGFEQPVVTHVDSWDVFSSIPGWTTSFGCGIEVQRGAIVGTPVEGVQLAELDSSDRLGTGCDTSSAVFQDVATTAGMKYELSLAFSPRPGVGDNRIEVSWDGVPLEILDGDGNANADTVWTYRTFQVTATSSTSRLAFADRGAVDTLGGYLDDVSLVALDRDGDGVTDDDDNCPDTANPHQKDTDADGTGDACDADPYESVEGSCPCDRDWRSHGEYMCCVTHTVHELEHHGLITRARARRLVSAAAHSSCGKTHGSDSDFDASDAEWARGEDARGRCDRSCSSHRR